MANNLEVDTVTGGGPTFATDEIGSAPAVHYPIMKLAFGADNTATWVTTSAGLPVDIVTSSVTVDNGGTFAVQVDELPTAGALADNTANPTTSLIGSCVLVWDGATWDRAPGDATNGLTVNLGSNNDVTVSGGTVTVDNAGTFAVQATQSGSWTVDLGATDNAVLDSIAAGYATEGSALGSGILLQGDDGTDRTNVAVTTAGHVEVDVQNAVTVNGSVTADAGTGIATSANQTTIIGHVDGIEGLLTTMDADTSTIAGAVSGTEMQVDVVAALPGGDNNIGNVDILTVAAGSNLIGDVGLSGARISGGTTPFRDIDADETAIEISDTQAQLYWIHCMNLTAATLYLHFYNIADTGVTVGTSTPTLTFAIPTQGDTNGAGFALSVPNGIAFGTALSAAVTTTVGGSAGPAANGCILNVGYAN